MVWTAVPKAAINKDSDFLPRENDVCLAAQVPLRARVLSKA